MKKEMKIDWIKISEMNMKKVIVSILLIGCLFCMFTACSSEKTETADEEPMLKNCSLIHMDENTGVDFQISIDEFNDLGFEYGDSVDITFSNGYSMEDIPYYNGYYVEVYEPLLVAYPGAEYVKATFNYGDDLWVTADLKEGDTGSVTLREKAKYLDIQKASDMQYTDDRDDYPSDEVFANFRSVTAGNIKDIVLYRSASPCDNRHNRARYADKLAKNADVKCIVDLADNDEEIEGYITSKDFDSPYFLELYQNGNVLPLYMSMNYLSDDFRKTLMEGLTEMTEKEGPYLIHCTEGKDRTGFVCMLLEALCGASYQDIERDYMITYDNYYGINKETDPERYNTIKENNLDAMLEAIVLDENEDITALDLSGYAKDYLLDIGMSEQTVDTLKNILEQ